MDFILLKSGDVMASPKEHMSGEITRVLREMNAESYYYKLDSGIWYCKHAWEADTVGCGRVEGHKVPEVVKLAQMLE